MLKTHFYNKVIKKVCRTNGTFGRQYYKIGYSILVKPLHITEVLTMR